MLKDFKWISEGNYHSKVVGNYEVTVERMADFYRVSLWKGSSKELVESLDFAGTDLNTLLRALALADQLIKQNKKVTPPASNE